MFQGTFFKFFTELSEGVTDFCNYQSLRKNSVMMHAWEQKQCCQEKPVVVVTLPLFRTSLARAEASPQASKKP